MLSSLLGFELKYHFRQLTFKIAALLFFALGILVIQGGFGGVDVHKNSPYVITVAVGILSLFSIFAITLFCANVVLRDTTHKMDALLFTTAVKRLPYFATRLLGLVIVVFFIICLALLGMYVGSIMTNPSQIGPYKLVYYLYPLFIFGLLNILFACSLLFGVAMLTRSVRAVYAVGVLLYILYWVASILGNSPLMAGPALKANEHSLLPFLLDPFGLASVFGDTRSWSDLQRNSQLFPISRVFLLNRLLWTALTTVLVILCYRLFQFRLYMPAKNNRQKKQKASTLIPYKSYQGYPQGFLYGWKSFASQLKLELISLFKNIPFMVMLLLWIFMFAMELKDILFEGSYGIHAYPSSGIIAEEIRSMKPAMLLIIFFAAELLARERASNMQALIYSSPIRSVTLWGAKSLTIGVLVATLVTLNICIGIVMQLIGGYSPIELPVYLSLYYYSGLPLFLFALLVIFIQTLITEKYLGMLISLVVTFIILFGNRLGIEHYLLRYASVPDLNFSAMNGFGHYAKAFNWYMLYWACFAAIFSLLTIGIWKSSTHITFKQRIRSIGNRLGKTGGFLLLISLLGCISAGTYIYRATNITGKYKSSGARQEWKLQYEKKYKPLSTLPQPIITTVKTTVDLYPEAAKYKVKGSYLLKNKSGLPISRIWAGLDPEVTASSISIPGSIKQTHDAVYDQYFFDLKKPLLPGEEMSMDFSIEVSTSGFTRFNTENSVVANGSYIELEKYVPFLGYNSDFESQDPHNRQKAGLSAISTTEMPDSNYHLIDLETTISTDADQYIVTVGSLQKTWTSGNRSYFTYKTTAPINFMFALCSGRYAVKKEIYKGVTFSIFYHRDHTYNLVTIMQGMKDAMDYCNSNFGAYPFTQFTLAEIPQYRAAATAYPGLIFSAEKINFMSDFSDTSKVNYGYALVAHEVAHQWWANKLAPIQIPGAPTLKESLAKYTEAMIVEKHFGKMYLRNYLQMDNNLYFALRGGERELPLDSTIGQTYVFYQKGGLAMYAIKETLGEEKVNGSLRRLIEKHASPHTKATVANLIDELCQDATASQVNRINDMLRKVIVFKTSIEILSCKPLPNGQFSLSLRIRTGKSDQDQQQVPLDDEMDIAIFDQSTANWNIHTKPIYLQKHQFTKKDTVLTIIINQKPASVAIDPYGYLLDDNQQDNMKDIQQ